MQKGFSSLAIANVRKIWGHRRQFQEVEPNPHRARTGRVRRG
jgi:hypothetical protein